MARLNQAALDRQAGLSPVEGLQFLDGLHDLTAPNQLTAPVEHRVLFRPPSLSSEKATDSHGTTTIAIGLSTANTRSRLIAVTTSRNHHGRS